MQTHAKSLVESYGNSYYTTSDRNCRMHVTSSCSLPLVLFLGGIWASASGGRNGRQDAGVAGRGWGRTPGAAQEVEPDRMAL